MRNRLFLAALMVALLTQGCGEDPGGTTPGGGTGHGNPGKTWTFLVYMVADNNLEPFALADMAEMAQVGSTDQVKIVVQIDRAAAYSADPLGNIPDFTGAKRILVEQGNVRNSRIGSARPKMLRTISTAVASEVASRAHSRSWRTS